MGLGCKAKGFLVQSLEWANHGRMFLVCQDNYPGSLEQASNPAPPKCSHNLLVCFLILTSGHLRDPAGSPDHGQTQNRAVEVQLILGEGGFNPHGDADTETHTFYKLADIRLTFSPASG